MHRLPLSDLDLFVAVAKHRNFRRAALDRGLSPSTLSQSIRELEERLGVRLLNRTTRSVTPTEAGQRLLQRLSPLLAEVADAVDEVNTFRDTPTGTLRLNVPSVVSKLILGPLLPAFLAAHPGIRLEIADEDSFIDVFEAGFDAGVRFGESLALDMIAVPFGAFQRFAVAASPALLERVGTPRVPRDLLGLPCIRHRFPSGVRSVWEFQRDADTVKIAVDGPLVVSSPELAIAAAEDGVGFCSSFHGFLAQSFAQGRLIEVLEDWSERFPGPFLYYPSRRHVPGPLAALVRFLRQHAPPKAIP